jgi:propanediol dehydratase large subunit
MGFHEAKSMLYLEARCLCMQRAMGAQGTQNGGIDGAPLASTVPGGVRELMAENLIAVWLDLECASGNDARTSESEIRIGAKILPFLLAGSDLICSGMGSILSYDNSFNPSLFNGEQLEDYLVLQRDFEADGGLRPIEETEVLALQTARRRCAGRGAGGTRPRSAERRDEAVVVVASGSNDTESYSPREAAEISEAITSRKITVIDVVRALHARGFAEEADNLLKLVKLRISGDYLQTSAIVRDGAVIAAINDPNEYAGPGTGYRLSEARRNEIAAIRDVLDRDEVLRTEATYARARRAASPTAASARRPRAPTPAKW